MSQKVNGSQHRSSLKQKNKKFKGGSKLKSVGKVAKKQKSNTQPKIISKALRKSTSKSIQAAKKEQLNDTKKVFQGPDGAPKLISVIPLGFSTCSSSFIQSFATTNSLNQLQDGTYYSAISKQRIQFFPITKDSCDFFHLLDLCLISDFSIFLLNGNESEESSEEENFFIDDWGVSFMKVLMSQGIPSPVFCIQGNIPMENTKQTDLLRRLALQQSSNYCADVEKVFFANSAKDVVEIGRFLFAKYPKSISWRQNYPYLLVDNYQLIQNEDHPEQTDLMVTGYSRGRQFNVDNSVHIAGLGDFSIEYVEAESMTLTKESLAAYKKPINESELKSLVVDGSFSMEEDEVSEEIEEDEVKKIVVRVPKGTSSYQASWYVGNSDDENEMNAEDEEEEEDELEDVVLESRESKVKFADIDMIEEREQLEAFRTAKEEEEDDLLYPDEIEIPDGVSASAFLSEYRGVKSLRHVDWDPYDELPTEYENVFHFSNFKLSQRKALKEECSTNISSGSRVILRISNIPKDLFIQQYASSAKRIIVFGLLKHETNLTVSHANLKRTAEYDGIIKNNDKFIVTVGFKRYETNVLLSEYDNSNVHKMLRYFQPNVTLVGSFYASVSYPSQPVNLYLSPSSESAMETSQSIPTLVATGSLLDPNPLRIIVERVSLTGSPYKIFKRTSVVRFMFFNPEDVNYFKPVELSTKSGRIGNIKESLGTHGYMKCIFDKQIQQNDTIYMHLYKRIFPQSQHADTIYYRR